MNIYKARRRRLVESVGQSLIIVPAFDRMQSTNDAAAPFIQEANFMYLTGIDEPSWTLVIDGILSQSYLVAPKADRYTEIFYGQIDSEDMQKSAGVDAVISQHEFKDKLAGWNSDVWCLKPEKSSFFSSNPAQSRIYRAIKRLHGEPKDCRPALNKLRAIKQPEEIAALRAAIDTTCQAFKLIHQNLREYNYEYEIEADFTQNFRRKNATHAYDPIVAAGKNALILHYDKNSQQLENNDFVLLDIGARQNDYAADITRTYAIGELSKRQQQVFRGLQAAQRDIIKLIRPGVSFADYIQQADERMKALLCELGLMSSMEDTDNYRRYFPHAISHGLGLDVHDSLGGYGKFQPGMVLTVEPGVYIPEEAIGIRIEDDILVTDKSHENLSAALSTDW